MKRIWSWFINLSVPKILLLASTMLLFLFIGMIAFTAAISPYLLKQDKLAEKPAFEKSKTEKSESKNDKKPKSKKKSEDKLYLVTKVIDGDTIEIEGGQRVRYIGINTPETGQPFADEATSENKELVEGNQVKLEKDVSETDKYGRLLRYVYVLPDIHSEPIFVNAELVKLGFANAATYPPDVKHAEDFMELERQARENNIGIWATSSEESHEESSGSAFVGSKKSDVYHYPSCVWAKKIKSENLLSFASVNEAQEKGYRPCKVCAPPSQ